MRVLWTGAGAANLRLEWDQKVQWAAKGLTKSPTWQWVKAGVFELPPGPFKMKLRDDRDGTASVDQLLLTTDLRHVPAH